MAHPSAQSQGARGGEAAGPGAGRGFSVSFLPVGPPCRACSRMAPSTSTSTSPRVASTQTPGRRPSTAGSPRSTCHGVSTRAVRRGNRPRARPTRAGGRPWPREAGVSGLGSSPIYPLCLCRHLCVAGRGGREQAEKGTVEGQGTVFLEEWGRLMLAARPGQSRHSRMVCEGTTEEVSRADRTASAPLDPV